MASYDDFKVGFGALITGGAIKVIQNINLGNSTNPVYVNMHPLGTLLVIVGLSFVAIGFISRFVMRPLKQASANEKKEIAEEDKASD